MASLDREESAADTPKLTEAIPPDVAVRDVRQLPEIWRKAEGGSGRPLLASALFSRIEVLGMAEATVHSASTPCDTALRDATGKRCEYSPLVGARGFGPPVPD